MSLPKQRLVDDLSRPGSLVEPVLTIDPRRVFLTLCACIATLLGCYIVTVATRLLTTHHWLFGLVRLFDLDAEANVPTFFSVLQLATAALLLNMIGRQARLRSDPFARLWLGLGAIFLFLAMDELAQIHELLRPAANSPMHASGMLYYGWVIPYGVLTATVGAIYIRFLLHLPVRTRWLMVLSGLIYVGGAAGLEIYGGYLEAHLGPEAAQNSLAYLVEVFFEEGMEMFGIALFIYTLLDHIRSTAGRVAINVGPAPLALAGKDVRAADSTQGIELGRVAGRLTAP